MCVVESSSGHTAWRPDGYKQLWCLNSCHSHYGIYIDHCCGCNTKPKWSFTGLKELSVEITDTTGYNSFLLDINPRSVYYRFLHTFNYLCKMPQNICQFPVVHIDVTGNRFIDIENISCIYDLDTLIMKRNMLTYVSNETFRGLTKHRLIDLSQNFITQMDNNLFEGIHVLSLHFE